MKFKFIYSYSYSYAYSCTFAFIYAALVLTAKVLASNAVVPVHPTAVQVMEQFGILGLCDSTDLEWFSSRWNMENDINVFLKFSLLRSQCFSDNRVPLIKHILEAFQFDFELVQLLVDMKEYEILIELLYKYPKQMNENLFGFLNCEYRMEEFYKVLKVSSNMETFLENSEDNTPFCNLAILDNEPLPPSLLTFFLSKFDIPKIIIDFTVKHVKDPSISKEEIYMKITRFWSYYVQNNFPNFYEKLFRIIISSDDVTLEDLAITEFDSMEHKISLFSMALILKKEILLDQIIFFYSFDDLKNVINIIVNVNKYEEDLCSYLIFCVFGKLPKVVQTLILNSSNYNIFVEKKFKIFKVKITDFGGALIKFGSDDLVQVYGIPTRLNCEIVGPITVGKLKDWFDNMKFASPKNFSQFLDEISKLPAFKKLIKLEHVNVHINSLMQVATDEALNNQIRSLGLFLHSESDDLETRKLLKQENLLNMTEIVSKSLMIKLIRLAIYDQVSWKNLDRSCGGKLSEILMECSSDFNESEQLILRSSLLGDK